MFKTTEQGQRRKIAEYLVVAVVAVAGGEYLGLGPVIIGAALGTALGGAARHWVKLQQVGGRL